MPQHDCDQPAIQNLLDGWFLPATAANRPRFVVVADIGQGNLNAIFNEDGQVFLYYDFGGGWVGNLFTFPAPAPQFCFNFAGVPKFILSNWDGDHVKSAVDRIGTGFFANKRWLVPAFEATSKAYKTRAGLSGKAVSLRKAMATHPGEVYKWPDDRIDTMGNVRSVTSSHFTVMRAFGSDANNAGLVLRIQNPSGANNFMLLPGDSAYETGALVHGCDQRCVAVVASHHGAEIHDKNEIPRPLPDTDPAIGFSFGWGNGYGHPISSGWKTKKLGKKKTVQVKQRGIESYAKRLWTDSNRADTAGAEAGAELAGPRGNVGFIWPNAVIGPGCVHGEATPDKVNGAAVHLIASSAAEVEVYQAGLAEGPHIAVAAAYQAASEAGARANKPTPHGALVAAAMVTPQVAVGGVPPTLTVVANAIDANVAGELAAALLVANAAATAASVAALQALATAMAEAVMTAASRVQEDVTTAAGIGINDVDNANSIGSEACRLGYAKAQDPATLGAAETEISNLQADAVVNQATAISAVGAPTRVEVKKAIAELVTQVAQQAMGNPANSHTGTPMRSAKQPPAAAEAALAALTIALRGDVAVGLAAAAGMQPSIPINPQAAAPGMPIPLNAYALESARTAAVAAMVGFTTNPMAPPARGQVVRAAVAAARVALAAASGAPQVNCHRHPKLCGTFCTLSIHYLVQGGEFLQVTGLTPALVTVNAAGFTLTVDGANFRNGAAVRWGGHDLLTVFVSASQVTATVPLGNLTVIANIAITVRNPGGQISNPAGFAVMAPPPAITGLSHLAVVVNSPGFTLTLGGTDFQNGAVVGLAGQAVVTQFVDATHLTADLPTNALTAVGPLTLQVRNPDGRFSNVSALQVRAPQPVVLVLNPNTCVAGSGNFALQVGGTGFAAGAVINWAVTPQVTAVTDAQNCSTNIAANLVAAAGTVAITVTNMDGQVSMAANFTITAPAPQIAGLNPDFVRVGGGAIVLTINGANFQPGAVVLGGINVIPNSVVVNVGQITVPLAANVLQAPIVVQITVRNPDGQVSNQSPFEVKPSLKRSFS